MSALPNWQVPYAQAVTHNAGPPSAAREPNKKTSATLERASALSPTATSLELVFAQGIEPGGLSADLVEATPRSLAVNRLSGAARAKTRGLALQAYTKMLIQLDPDDPPTSPEELKQYRKLMARRAKKQLVAKEAIIQARNITQEQFRGQKGALNASSFAKSLLENAQAALAGPSPTQDDVGGDEEDGDADIDDSLFDEGDKEEDEIEEAAARGDVEQSFFVRPDEEEPSSDQLRPGQATESTVQFKDLATSFMNLLMENRLTAHTGPWKSSNATCPMCEDDGTVSTQDKAEIWTSQSHFERHMSNPSWSCPYCINSKQYPHLSDVERHIRDSKMHLDNPESVRHERLKNEDGWFEADWVGRISKERERSQRRAIQRNMKTMGTVFADDPSELSESVPAPGQTNIVLGGPPREIPARALATSTFLSEPSGSSTIPPSLQLRVELVNFRNRRLEIPSEFEHLIEHADSPGSKPDTKGSKSKR